MGTRENECQISQKDILHMKISEFFLRFHNLCKILKIISSGTHKKISLVLLQIHL